MMPLRIRLFLLGFLVHCSNGNGVIIEEWSPQQDDDCDDDLISIEDLRITGYYNNNEYPLVSRGSDDDDADGIERIFGGRGVKKERKQHRKRLRKQRKSSSSSSSTDRSSSSRSSTDRSSISISSSMDSDGDIAVYEFGLDKLGMFEMENEVDRSQYIKRIRRNFNRGISKKKSRGAKRMPSQHSSSTYSTMVGNEKRVIVDGKCEDDTVELLRCLRFSKINFAPDYVPPKEMTFPLNKNDYPIQKYLSPILKESFCPSVIDSNDAEFNENIDALLRDIGGGPSFPDCDPHNPFWDDLEETMDVQVLRKRNPDTPACTLMDLPELWQGYTLTDAADAVHDEYPGLHQAQLIGSLLKQKVKPDPEIIPQRTKRGYLRGPVMLSELNTWAVGEVGGHSFQAKWHLGRPRPEEVFWKVMEMMRTEDRSCVPKDIAKKVPLLKMDLESSSPTDFTAYPEGSPDHPSWPAMHSAASSSSLWLAVVCQLTPEQITEAKKTDYAVAYARTVAGVHYPTDNVDGLNIGQEVIAKVLPLYLNGKYGSDIAKVEAKIAKLRFDWKDYEMEVGCS